MRLKLAIAILFFYATSAFCGSEFSAENLEAACRAYLNRIAPAGAQVEILQQIKPESFEVDGVRAKCEGTAFEGLGKITIEFQADGKIIRKVGVTAKIKTFIKAPEIIIKRGDRIALEVTSGAIAIRTEAVAMEAGALGEWIKVKREGGATEVLRAKVTGEGFAAIDCR